MLGKLSNILSNMIYNHYIKRKELKSESLISFESELKEVYTQIDSIVDAATKGMFHKSLIDKMTDLEAKKNELQSLIEDCKRSELPVTPEIIKEHLSTQSKVKSIDFTQQKKTLRSYIEKVTIHNDKVIVHYIVDVTPGGEGN